MATIAYLEDDLALGQVVSDMLHAEGYDISWYQAAEPLLAELSGHQAFILDVNLPGIDGFAVAEKIREQDGRVPMLFLTARLQQEDKLRGLRLGADDYLVKPFSMEELVLKLNRLLSRDTKMPEVFSLGSHELHLAAYELRSPTHTIRLTEKELGIIHHLVQHLNEVVRRDDLLLAVWGDTDYFHGRSMDVYISKLRKYLAAESRVKIENIHGVGFSLQIKD